MLKVEDLPLTEPGEGEVRLKVEAIGLNRAEVMFREGQYLEEPEFPSRLGYEAAGVVDAVGPGTKGIQVGDRVSAGETLLVLEAMKMEHPMRATEDGVVTAVRVAVGDQVEGGALLLVVEPAGGEPEKGES